MSDEANTAAPVAPESVPVQAAAPASEPASAPAPETPAAAEAAPAAPEASPEPTPAASVEASVAAEELIEKEREIESVQERSDLYFEDPYRETPEDHPSRMSPGLRPAPAGPQTPNDKSEDEEGRA